EAGSGARQPGVGDVRVHQQGFHGAADAGPVGLGVDRDVQRAVQVGRLVDVDVAVAFQVLDQGHARFVGQAGDEALAAARDDDVDPFRVGDHFAHGGAVGGVHDLHGVRRQPGGFQAGLDDGAQGAVGMEGLAAAAPDGGVAGSEAQGGGGDGHVRPGFVDDADHAQGHAHAGHAHAVGPGGGFAEAADRVGHGGDLEQAFDHQVQRPVGQAQAVHHRSIQPAFGGGAQIARVFFLQPGAAGAQAVGHGPQGGGLGGAGGRAQDAGRLPGLAAQGLHGKTGGGVVHGMSV